MLNTEIGVNDGHRTPLIVWESDEVVVIIWLNTFILLPFDRVKLLSVKDEYYIFPIISGVLQADINDRFAL